MVTSGVVNLRVFQTQKYKSINNTVGQYSEGIGEGRPGMEIPGVWDWLVRSLFLPSNASALQQGPSAEAVP